MANEGAPPHYQHSILPLPLLSIDDLGADSALMYATIAAVVSAVLLVAVGLLVLAALCQCCRARQRNQLPKGGEKEVKNSELALRVQEEEICNLRRTASTTGFPTAEKYKRQCHKKSPDSQRHTQPPAPPESVPPRSRSLPNLSLPAVRSKRIFPAPHRRNLGKPFTTIKMLNGSSQLRGAIWHGHKDLTPIKVIQNDLGSRHPHSQRSELVSYAVHSLAASANTPEPGSHPATEL